MDLESEARRLVAVPLGSGALMGVASLLSSATPLCCIRAAASPDTGAGRSRYMVAHAWSDHEGPLACTMWCWLSWGHAGSWLSFHRSVTAAASGELPSF